MSEPVWVGVARKYINTKEVPGPKNNPVIIGWAKRLGGWFASFYTKDEIPWCGLFVANCMKECGFPVQGDALSALGWGDYGTRVQPCLGAIMIFKRTGGGHVGFYVSEDANTFHILGGNQGDNVSIVRIEKSRFHDSRWPPGARPPRTGRVMSSKFGGSISKNEA